MKKLSVRLSAMMLFGASLIAPLSGYAAEGVDVNYLGVNNTLVRVIGEGKYLVIPVQESEEDSKINVLVDGKFVETIYVKLSKSNIDYSVPYDLTPYKGHKVVLEIISPQRASSVKDMSCWSGIELSNTFDITNREKFRPAFHHTPLYGWMNDPNGMFYKDGKWHLYYQYNPYGSKWQNMTWGHSLSSDLVNWEHQPIAIRPDALGSIFSGSCTIDKENTSGFGKDAVIALYTSASTSQMQSIASSQDNGKTFDIYSGNPIITLETEARDPKVFWNEKTKEWNLILAHALDHEMLIFSSADMKNWDLLSSFGKGLGAQDGVWECPDLFELPVKGSNKTKWVLICNINPGGPFGGSGTQYFIGEYDGKTFKVDLDKNGNVPTKWLDYGKDHYATVSWDNAPSNRRTVIGWMSNWEYAAEVPTLQFRSANTLPREIALFTAPDGEIYASSAPSPELLSLRGELVQSANKTTIVDNKQSYTLPITNDGVCEIVLEADAKKSKEFIIELSNNEADKVLMTYNSQSRTLSFDRTQSGIVDFSESFPAVTVTPTYENNGRISLRIFIDRSSIELFEKDGRFVMTNLVFPNKPYSTLSISTVGGNAKLNDLKIYSIKVNQ
ncbi:MAG: GH32 C-terminal domain-containing protein [Bacteroidales bacterium]